MITYTKTAGYRATMKLYRIILTTLLIFCGACGVCFAQTTASEGGNVKEDNPQGLPAGYTALILDMEGIKMRMTLEQRNDRGSHWPAWMRPGLEEGNSIYWWLLAQWHHNEGNRDHAYRTLLTAWALARMEGTTCLSIEDKLLQRMLIDHKEILNMGASSNRAKREAVLAALKTAEKITEDKPLRGMICNITPARRAVERQRKNREKWEAAVEASIKAGKSPPKPDHVAPLTLIDNQVTRNERDQESIRIRQRRELDKVSKEYNANQAWEASDITTIMSLMDQQ